MADYSAGGQASGTPEANQLNDFDQTSADIPIWGWLSGASGRRDTQTARHTADANRGYFDSIRTPTADQLSGSQESQDAQSQALAQMQSWGRGGLTSTDQQMMRQRYQTDAQQSGAQRQALSQSAYARGMGGSGTDLALQQQSSQGAAQRSSDAATQMLESAQQRALAAVQASGQLGTQMRGQDQNAVSGAYQAAIERARGATGQYGTDASTAQGNANRRQQSDTSLMGLIGGLLG